ncbi:hydroxymethylpyrimidine/phosphomethylpyrimidine kinase [Pararhizobium sp. BT-229]|uniref:hydroxymethylpyrimidine/phosphomethylpyrimidine kinase n=1 Tax=Pararhizobium sp. BT-229 TaxID=2986923 RepID=UPI0021F7EC22|nr:hydroxymethylpyrimidine/phosphomethylpyrimidine kinase [Pararhizobium sp. BT-229]MCV9962753.1 hydroxymethylpyrimidine/phosphomethylpyrimidine kinase [Pararhizobium sp. BT-229]
MKNTPHVLVVAGSDSSGGAGIVRDIETLAAFGVKASIAITAVTVQTHKEVRRVDAVSPDCVVEQMRAALSANPVAAIKIGMLANDATISAVTSVLVEHPDIPVVLDPVLASTSGGTLLTPEAKAPLLRLFEHCALITPNLPELRQLVALGETGTPEGAAEQARHLIAGGARAILVKGGHGDGLESVDILVLPGQADQSFVAPRLAASMRGTGCMLASAIAADLAAGADLATAITTAKAFVYRKLAAT